MTRLDFCTDMLVLRLGFSDLKFPNLARRRPLVDATEAGTCTGLAPIVSTSDEEPLPLEGQVDSLSFTLA